MGVGPCQIFQTLFSSQNHGPLPRFKACLLYTSPGLLGSRKSFESFTRSLERGYAPLRRLVRPFIRRRMKTDPALVPDLPDKTEIPAYCSLTPEQLSLIHI